MKCSFCKKEIKDKAKLKKISSGIKSGGQKKGFCSKICYKKDLKKIHDKKYSTIKCDRCSKKFKRINVDIGKKNYCSRSCSAKINNLGKVRNGVLRKDRHCIFCDETIKNKNQRKYCNRECQTEYEHAIYIKKWKSGNIDGRVGKDGLSVHIKKYMFLKYKNKCSKCNWSKVHPVTNKVPLQVDHIDGNHLNNREKNLRLLCPNCHVLTPNYGSLNKGRGRKSKLDYYYRKKKN